MQLSAAPKASRIRASPSASAKFASSFCRIPGYSASAGPLSRPAWKISFPAVISQETSTSLEENRTSPSRMPHPDQPDIFYPGFLQGPADIAACLQRNGSRVDNGAGALRHDQRLHAVPVQRPVRTRPIACGKGFAVFVATQTSAAIAFSPEAPPAGGPPGAAE